MGALTLNTGNVDAGSNNLTVNGAVNASGAITANAVTASGNVTLGTAASSIGTLTVNNADITLNHNLTGNVVQNQNTIGGTARNFTLAATRTLTGNYTASKSSTNNANAFGLVTINGTVTGSVSLTDASRGPLSSDATTWLAGTQADVIVMGNNSAVNGSITLVENTDNQTPTARRQGIGRINAGTGVVIGGAVTTGGALILGANSKVNAAVTVANQYPNPNAGETQALYASNAVLTMAAGSEITGNVVSGGNTTLTGTAKITGDFEFSALGTQARTLSADATSEITGTFTVNRANTAITSSAAVVTAPTSSGSKFGALNVTSTVTFPGGTIANNITSSAALTISGTTVVTNDITSSGYIHS
jgi:hypothetical protein